MSHLTIEQARGFCAVASAQSYILAAERLGLEGHVPLIRLVGRLGEAVGRGPLVSANSKGKVTVTAVGLEILPAAQRLVAAADGILDARAEIRFSAYPSIAARVATRCPQLLDADLPLVLNDVSEVSRDDGGRTLVRNVADGVLDLAIAPTGLTDEGELAERFLYTWALRIVPPETGDHPLAGRRTVTPADVARYRIAASPPGHKSRALLEGAFALDKIPLDVDLSSSSQEVLRSAAMTGRFVAVIPDDAFEDPEIGPCLVVDRKPIGGDYALYLRRRSTDEATGRRDVAIEQAAAAIVDALGRGAVRRRS